MFDRTQSTVAHVDPEIWAAIQAENRRQEEHIELIASENYTSPGGDGRAGLAADQQVRRGLPRQALLRRLRVRRRGRAAGHRPRSSSCSAPSFANVQPNSGSQANQAVFFGLLQPGDTIMGMSLAEGGHLTHGMALNMSGKWFKVVSYGLDANEAIDYDAMERLAHEHKPKLIIAGASAYSLRIDFERFAKVAKAIGAIFMVDMAHYAGLIAAGVYPNPVPHADVVTTHHAQEPARPARRHHPDERRGDRQEDQQRHLPRHPGRPADARDRRQGGGLQGGAGARVQGLPAAGGDQRRACWPRR